MYIFAGGAKMGPWFKYVVQVLVKDAIITPCLPKHTLPRLSSELLWGVRDDVVPRLHCGDVADGICVRVAVLLHLHQHVPLWASHNFSIPSSPGLIVFLLVALFIIPIIGHIWPQLVPFLMAYRQYAGNWRMGVWIVRKSAVQKLLRIKTYNGLLWFDEAPLELGGSIPARTIKIDDVMLVAAAVKVLVAVAVLASVVSMG